MDLKQIIKKTLFPPIWLMIILVLISAVALSFVFINDADTSPLSYGVYVISLYTVTVVCIFCVAVLPKRYKEVKSRIYRHPIGKRYMTDTAFRTHISLYFSLAFNLFYVGTNIVSCVVYSSAWFGILAGYYAILAIMRFILLRFFNRNGIGNNRISELKSSRLCGYIMMTLNITLSGAVLMILYHGKGYEYHGMLIYVMALYAFYITAHAAVNIVKYRKYNSPVIISSKVITFSAALVSMLSLETAMFAQFGAEMADTSKRRMIALTGAGVSITVIAMSIFMIAHTTKEIWKLRSKQ